MKLTYFRGKAPNFGDELNAILWRQILPEGFLDEDESELFLGIGSILWDYLPTDKMKHVIGSGYGSYSQPPNASGPDWNVVWVRGPRTAQAIGVDPSLAITDAAVLVRVAPKPAPAPDVKIAFMPHFESIGRGDWEAACRLAGVTYIDPRADPSLIMAQILGARLVITEAMHGAIVSDALRVPWIAVRPFLRQHWAKWSDWADSLRIDLRWAVLPASTLLETYGRYYGGGGAGGRSRRLLSGGHVALMDAGLTHRAARALQKTAEQVEPQLSDDGEIAGATERCQAALDAFVNERLSFRRRA